MSAIFIFGVCRVYVRTFTIPNYMTFRPQKRLSTLVGVILVVLVVGLYHLHKEFTTQGAFPTANLIDVLKWQKRGVLQFPASFSKEKVKTLTTNVNFLRNFKIYEAESPRPEPAIPDVVARGTYREQPISIFTSEQNLHLDLEKCHKINRQLDGVTVADKIGLVSNIEAIVREIVDSIDRKENSYMGEFLPYLYSQAKLQLEMGVVDQHWFQLAGSSVWLKEYGVHMLVSRLAYSAKARRNNPKFSFLYTQLYDESWKEVSRTLVVPTTLNLAPNHFQEDDQMYTLMKYPSVLSIPFFHSYNDMLRIFLGSEDPRLILVKNKNGYEEPLIVFNAVHQKPEWIDDDEDNFLVHRMKLPRAIWLGWPWQFQKGKVNTDYYADAAFDDSVYNRVKELQIKNAKRQQSQKNWTPMLSEFGREQYGYDKEILLVYRWSSLQVLKCDLDTQEIKCGFVFQQNERLRVTSSVGPLRGGSQLMNLNTMFQEKDIEGLIPARKEIWVGFARAHLTDCGCGSSFYRPNMVFIVHDLDKESFTLSHVSSFMSLGMDIISWNLNNPYELCAGTNVLIPNGIPTWTVEKTSDGFEDTLAIAVSVSDATLDIVYMKNILSAFFKKENMEEMVFGVDDNLACAMIASEAFCSTYGDIMIGIQKEKEKEGFTIPVTKKKGGDLQKYRGVLEDLGLNW